MWLHLGRLAWGHHPLVSRAICHACVSRRWDSAVAVLGGSVPTWKADKAQLLVGGHPLRKLGVCRSHSCCAAATGPVGPKALPSGEQDLSYRSGEHGGDALVLLFQCEPPPWSELVCVCVQMRWQRTFADGMPALPPAPAGILLSAELIGILFNNPLFYPFRRVKHTLLFVLINGCAGQYLPTLLRK